MKDFVSIGYTEISEGNEAPRSVYEDTVHCLPQYRIVFFVLHLHLVKFSTGYDAVVKTPVILRRFEPYGEVSELLNFLRNII